MLLGTAVQRRVLRSESHLSTGAKLHINQGDNLDSCEGSMAHLPATSPGTQSGLEGRQCLDRLNGQLDGPLCGQRHLNEQLLEECEERQLADLLLRLKRLGSGDGPRWQVVQGLPTDNGLLDLPNLCSMSVSRRALVQSAGNHAEHMRLQLTGGNAQAQGVMHTAQADGTHSSLPGKQAARNAALK